MTMYTATVEVATRIDRAKVEVDDFDTIVDKLAHHSPAVHISTRGWLTVTLTLPGETLAQATTAALALVEQATSSTAVAAEILTETEYDARQGWSSLPELLSVTEAAQLLKVSRQAVLDRISRGTLPATKVGREYVIQSTAVIAERPQRPA